MAACQANITVGAARAGGAKDTEAKALEDSGPRRTYSVQDSLGQVLFHRDEMAARVRELGRRIGADYAKLRPVLCPILKGGFIFAADLLRALDPCPEGTVVEFVSARSYGRATETSGTVEVSFDRAAVAGRHCLMVDDLSDSGLTLHTVHGLLLEAGAASVKSVVLLDKRARRKVDYHPDYIGFDCPNQWVVGMGMDTAQLYRSLDCVAVLKPEAIQEALAS